MDLDLRLGVSALAGPLKRFWELSGRKLELLRKSWDVSRGTPVYTSGGRYTTRGWTEWTRGFHYGSGFLQFEATGDAAALEHAREGTLRCMAPHLTHVGVHDHGFNTVSTYGNWLRLLREGRVDGVDRDADYAGLALKVSGAVQAMRWTGLGRSGEGYIYSFNGPHSLFIDTMRSLRVLGMAHALGHVLMGERDCRVDLFDRLRSHGVTTARHAVFYGEGRDAYDVVGRVAHESLFNVNDGSYRCPGTQQGYSPFSTWTRGLAWALLGFAEQLEFLVAGGIRLRVPSGGLELGPSVATGWGVEECGPVFLKAALASAERFLQVASRDGVPVWDDGAPGLVFMPGYGDRDSDPFNAHEPFDSSAAAIAAQGFLRLSGVLAGMGRVVLARRYRQAGLGLVRTLLSEHYLSVAPRHEGLLLHSVYHRPNGWDRVARGQKVPNGESSMWGDYHLREVALMLWRELDGRSAQRFFDGLSWGS